MIIVEQVAREFRSADLKILNVPHVGTAQILRLHSSTM